MENLTDINYWTKKLGHLPIHLKPTISNKYLLLNGTSGDFCIHISNTEEIESPYSYYSQSWSSNTKNYLVLNNDNVKLYNWSKNNDIENISFNSIKNNVEKFYKYLVNKSHRSDKDVVPHVIDIFRQFRTLTNEYKSPLNSLRLLFVLLASLEDRNYKNFDFKKWGITEIMIPPNFDNFAELFNNGLGQINPDLNLILRHTAGNIFQEAQKEVLFFDSQINLFGTFTGNVISKNTAYSSIHYTPSYLARTIVENCLNSMCLDITSDLKILDPACGSAEFLIEILKQLRERNYKGKINILGYDISETAVETSRFLLNYEKKMNFGEQLIFEIKTTEDSLTEEWGEKWDCILMNPPFMSWEQLKDLDKKEAVRNTLGSYFSGKPNQASAFFFKATQSLNPFGVLGCVIPSSLLSYAAYADIRESLNKIISINLIGKLGNFVFEDALTDISIFIGQRPRKNGFIPTILWTRNEKGIAQDSLRELRKMQANKELFTDKIDYSIYKPHSFPTIHKSWKAISAKEDLLIRDLKRYLYVKKLISLSEIFDVLQGIRTGNNDAFKISIAEYEKLPLEEQVYFRPVVDNDAINNGYLQNNFFAWYPYDKNGIIINSELDLIEKTPIFSERLFRYKSKLQTRARKDETNWWHLSEHRAWLRKKQMKLVSTEFGNSSSFAIDKKGDYIIERGYSLQPKIKFDINDYYFYLAIFSSNFYDKLLSIYSKQLAGGKWYDLGKKSTKDIPIPDITNPNIKNSEGYQKLVDLGKRLSDGDSYVKSILDDIILIFYPIN